MPAVPDDEQSLVAGVKRLGAKALEIANGWAVHGTAITVEQANALGDLARSWGANLKMIDAEKELDTRPLVTDLARRRKRWAEGSKPWEQAISVVKGIVDAWREATRERAMAELPAAAPAEVAATVAALTAAPMATRKYYSCRVVDPMQVRAQWWRIDQKALDESAAALKDAFVEPGCELVVEERSTLG